MLKKELVDILACPACKGAIEYRDDRIICSACRKYYPVRDDIPIMLIAEAQDL